MSDSNEVKIINKHTGEVTTAQKARAKMQWNDENTSTTDDTEAKKARQVRAETDFAASVLAGGQSESGDKVSNEKKLSKNKSVKVEIKDLEGFITYAYLRKGQSLKTLAPGEIKAVSNNARLNERQFDDLLNLSKDDPLLAVPRQIFFSVREMDVQPLVRQEVHRFVCKVLKRHPIYDHNNLVPVIANLDGAMGPVEAIRVIAKLSQAAMASLTGLESPKPKDTEALRVNAIYCLALWLWESRGQQINRVIRWLYDGYWSVASPAGANSIKALQVVTGITEISSVGMACAQFKVEADECTQKATALQMRIDSLLAETGKLRQSANDLQEQIRERENTINEISKELNMERSAHADSRAHLGDDREHLRSNVIRRLKREVSLLTEGLQALRKEPPKIRVMDDHAERVLEGLKAAIRELE